MHPFTSSSVKLLSVCSFSVLYAALASGQSMCTTLDSSEDRNVCEEFTAGRDWLTSVQKVAAGSEVPDLSASTGRLYIFDSRQTDGSVAVYNLSTAVGLPHDTALTGNGGLDSKPRLLLAAPESNGLGGMATAPGGGNFLLANLEVRSQIGNGNQGIISSSSPNHLELSGVTLSTENTSPGSRNSSLFFMLQLSGNILQDKLQNNETASFDIHGCEFQLPDLLSWNNFVFFQTIRVATQPSGNDVARLTYSNNRIITRAYKDTNHVLEALAFTGNVELETGSTCNSVQDPAGKDLLGTTGNNLIQALAINPKSAGAIGFTNQYAWGWKLEQGVAQTVYETWESWKKLGVNTQCNNPSGSDGDSSLAVKVAVPIVVFAIVATVTVVSVIVGYKKIPKKSWQQLRSMVERFILRRDSSRLSSSVPGFNEKF